MNATKSVLEWLVDLDTSDPSIRWQVMRDLLAEPESVWSLERAKVEHEGWGAQLLALKDDDGQWAGGAHFPADFDFSGPEMEEVGQPWTSTSHCLSLLREFGLEPSTTRVRSMVGLIGANCRWEHDNQPYWEGEVEPCINGNAVANGAYFGVDMAPVVERLMGERLNDGGWNCDVERGSVRSSFATTISVLEGLLEYERATGGTSASQSARRSGEEYLLERSLFRRLSTGEPADDRFLFFLHPSRWHYDVLRAMDYFRSASLLTGESPDARLGEAIDHVRSKQTDDGLWRLDWSPAGRVWFDVDDGQDLPSRWITLRALRVLDWYDR